MVNQQTKRALELYLQKLHRMRKGQQAANILKQQPLLMRQHRAAPQAKHPHPHLQTSSPWD
jgi:hypothetical protein